RILIPIVRESAKDRAGRSAAGTVRISGRPGMLISYAESETDVSLINRLNLVHDAEDTVVRRRGSSQGVCVFQVGFSCDLDYFEWREHCGRLVVCGSRHHLFGAGVDLLFQRISAS